MPAPSPPCAVVVGLELNGLGVVRSLARAGAEVIALDTDLARPTCATRHGRKVRVAGLAGAALIEALLRLRATLDRDPVLFLTQEAAVETVSAQRAALQGAYRFSMPDHDLMLTLLDKLRFQALAERLGFPIPRAVRLNAANGTAGLEGLRFPCVLKPTTKHPDWARHFSKAYRLSDATEAEALWPAMRAVVDEVIVQEWIEGGDSDVYFCLQYRPPDGGRATSFTGRKLRQWPPLVGGTACCIPAPEAEADLTDLTGRFFAAAGFVGIGSMEYKRDRRDGRFYMVEPTVGRTDYQEEVATLNGVNIPWAACLGETGQPPPVPAPAAAPAGWRDPEGDANARAASPGAPEVTWNRWRDAYFRFDDPMPFVALKLGHAAERLRRLRRADP